MTARRSKLPGLQVPSGAKGADRQFFEALKERLELITGERGDPNARAVTHADLTATANRTRSSIATASESSSSSSSVDYTSLPLVSLVMAGANFRFMIQGPAVTEQFAVTVEDLLSIFPRKDLENVIPETWTFENENAAFDLSSSAPRIRFTEQPLGDGVEDTLPADETVWDLVIDDGVASFRVRNDDDDDGMVVWEAGRTADNADYFNVIADELQHKGISVTAFSVYEANLGTLPRRSGSFDITGLSGLTTDKPVHIWQAAAAYTGKGSLRDEIEMDFVGAGGYVLNATTIRVHWNSSGPVVGNVVFNYRIGT